MIRKIVCFVSLFLLLSSTVNAVEIAEILPKGRIRIIDIDAPNYIDAGEEFTINVTVINEKFLPANLVLQIDLSDGLLETVKKDIGEDFVFRISGRSTVTYNIKCEIRSGDIDWYREEYNVQAILYQKMPLIGLVTRDISDTKGIHVRSLISEKDKVKIMDFELPEKLDQNSKDFEINVTVKNEASFDYNGWVRVDLVEKSSVVPELEQYKQQLLK